MWGIGILVAWLALVVAISALLVRLALRLWRRRAELSRLVQVLAVAAAIPIALGLGGTLVALLTAFSVLRGNDQVPPEDRARILAEAISDGMNSSALALIVGVPVLIVAAVVSTRRERAPASEREGSGQGH